MTPRSPSPAARHAAAGRSAAHGIRLIDADGRRISRRLRRRGGLLPRPRPSRRDRGDAGADRPARLRAHALLHHAAGRGAGRRAGRPRAARASTTSISCRGGSEAIEAALKMARQYFVEIGQPQRRHFIARRQSYHGNTLGALAVGGNAWRRGQFEPLLIDVTPCLALLRLSRPARRRDATRPTARGWPRSSRRRSSASARTTSSPSSPRRWSARRSAACPPVPGYFQRVREICDRHGVLLILDEVMCGMGRTGTLHACEQEGIAPDLMAIAKGLGGGYQPIGALLVAAARSVDAMRDGLRRLPARPHLHRPSGRLRRGARGAAGDRSATSCSTTCKRRARGCATRLQRALRQPPARRRHPRPRPVPGASSWSPTAPPRRPSIRR